MHRTMHDAGGLVLLEFGLNEPGDGCSKRGQVLQSHTGEGWPPVAFTHSSTGEPTCKGGSPLGVSIARVHLFALGPLLLHLPP